MARHYNHASMRLGVNAVRLTRPFTGVGRYLDNVLREWATLRIPFDDVVLFAPAPLDPSQVTFPLERYRVEVCGRALPDPLWEWWTLAPRARALDVLFGPSYTLPLGYRGPAVVTYFGPATNDRGTFEWWRAALYDRLYRASARRASRVLTAAGVAKRRVVEVYGVPEARVEVIPLAAAAHFTPVADADRIARARRGHVGGDAPFVLFVGKLSGRHHIPRLIEAFGRVRAAGLPHRLVLVGPSVLGIDIRSLARAHHVGDAVVHVPRVPEADLPALYSAAAVFAFPATDAEGFGLPIVEAMACGTPVLSVAQGSVPEVAGDAALLVPSSTVDCLAGGLLRLLREGPLREELRRKGLDRARGLSWRTTAEKTMEALARAAGLE
jgi:glycosyltransferase involved in cell wall biosynthesis